MVIEETPTLERLLVVDQEGPTRINVISAPKLTVLGYSSNKYSELVIGSTPIQVQQPPSTSPSTINSISNFEDVCSSVMKNDSDKLDPETAHSEGLGTRIYRP